MKGLFILGLLILSYGTCEELHFLSDDNDFFDGESANSFDSVTGMAGTIINIAAKVIDIIKTSHTSTIKAKIEGKGFAYFRGGCTVRKLNGLRPDKYEEFITKILGDVRVPKVKIPQIKDQMMDMLDTDQGIAMKTYDLIFNADSPSNDECHSLSFVGVYNSKQTIDIFYSNMRSEFKLAPDVTIVTENWSYVGGVWSDTKDKIKEAPKSINKDEIQYLVAFFEYIGLEQFATTFGIKIPKL